MIQFRTLCAVTIEHEYYAGPCRDVRFIASAESALTIRNGRLRMVESGGGMRIVYQADESGEPIVPMPGGVLRIGLGSSDPYFSNFTSVGADFPSTAALYSNADTPGTLQAAGSAILAGSKIVHRAGGGARPLSLRLIDDAGRTLAESSLAEGDERAEVAFDTGRYPAGRYWVEESGAEGSTATAYYADPELARAGVCRILEIIIHPELYTREARFAIAFGARREELRYYVVAANYSDADLGRLSIADEGFGDDARPPVQFTPVLSDGFAGIEPRPALFGRPGDGLMLFRSVDPVPRRERGRRRIRLMRDGEALIDQLPGPEPERPNANMIVHI